jgi:molybdopterin converting factor subunit 1
MIVYFIVIFLAYLYYHHTMKINVLAFGIAKDIFGDSSVSVELCNDATLSNLKYLLEQQHPKLKQLATYMVAVNNEYALDGDIIHERDEIAIIPPVSGG